MVFNINFVQNKEILDVTKLKSFADDKLSIAYIMIPLNVSVENTVGTGEKMLPTKRGNSGRDQTESICRRQIKHCLHNDSSHCKCRKHCGKRRKECFLPAFSPFPTVFFQILLL